MTDISLSTDAMKYIRMATQLIHVDILDILISEDKLIFVVRKGQLGAAIGKKAKNLSLLRNRFKKTIKFVEEDDDKTVEINELVSDMVQAIADNNIHDIITKTKDKRPDVLVNAVARLAPKDINLNKREEKQVTVTFQVEQIPPK